MLDASMIIGNQNGIELISIDEKSGIEIDTGIFSGKIYALEGKGVSYTKREDFVEFRGGSDYGNGKVSVKKMPDGKTEEGKKITWKDGLAAFWHILRFNIFS